MWTWLSKFANIKYIDCLAMVFTAIGTVGATIAALWLANRDNKPKLKVHATINVIYPENTECFHLSCVNVGKLPIICTNFAFYPSRFKIKRFKLILPKTIKIGTGLSTPLPKLLQYSDRAEEYFTSSNFNDKTFQNVLSKHQWLAKLQLKWFWRVIAKTNIKEFKGKLSKSVIEKIISICFSKINKLHV